MKPQGVCIIAAGEPCFGVYAYNLAVSLKFRDPEAKVAVFYEPRTLCVLEPWEVDIFDELIELKPEHNFWYNGLINPVGWKLRAYQYSPFERTILLDGDSLWFGHRTVTSFFENEMSGLDWACLSKGQAFNVENEPNAMVIDHGPVWQMKQEFKLPWNSTLHVCHSQWLYFARNERTDGFFKGAVDLYDLCQQGLAFRGSCWRNTMVNDELVLSASTALQGCAPGRIPFVPTTDGGDHTLTPEQVIVNIVGEDTTEKAQVALRIYKFACDMMLDVGFKWKPRAWVKKVAPY
jgi:hypothetical protein